MDNKNLKEPNTLYQVSTFQALMLGYFKGVVTVEELLSHGEIGLGTFENADGEMILLDSKVYQAKNDGTVSEADLTTGIPFAVATYMQDAKTYSLNNACDFHILRQQLLTKIKENSGLNSMHFVQINATFDRVKVRSIKGKKSHHVSLKEVVKDSQREFECTNVKGTLVGLYCPSYLDGINVSGWHFHFISENRKMGGHVFDVSFKNADAKINKISNININFPKDEEFDTYALTSISQNDIAEVE